MPLLLITPRSNLNESMFIDAFTDRVRGFGVLGFHVIEALERDPQHLLAPEAALQLRQSAVHAPHLVVSWWSAEEGRHYVVGAAVQR